MNTTEMISRYHAGDTLRTIAREAGMSWQSIQQRLIRSGVQMRKRGRKPLGPEPRARRKDRQDPHLEERNEMIRELRKHGASIEFLAERFNLAESTIRIIVYFR